MLKPKDIHEIQFSRSFKGYDPDEVDKFLDRVTEDYSQLYRENAELLNKLEVLASKVSEFKNAEENLRAAKEKIYRMAQEMASKAKSEAAQIEREAKERAERIVIEAKRDCENQRRIYERLQLEVTRFKAKSIALFKSEIEQLNSLPDLQVDAKDELRIRADEMSAEEDAFKSPFVQEYTPKYVSPAQIDFGVLEDEDKAKETEAAALKAAADPKEDFASDYVHKPTGEGSMFSPHAKSGYTQEEIIFGDGKTAVAEPEVTEKSEALDVPEEPATEKAEEAVKQPEALDVPEEPQKKPAFVVRRVGEPAAEPTAESEGEEENVTADEIADSLPPAPEAQEGRIENGWYNETEEFEVLDSPKEEEPGAKQSSEEHPKFGQLRFGADYDIDEEEGGSRFGFFKKKK